MDCAIRVKTQFSKEIPVGGKFIFLDHIEGNTLPSVFQKLLILEDAKAKYIAIAVFKEGRSMPFPLHGQESVIELA